MKYDVQGYALIPIKVRMEVDAETADAAVQKALRRFHSSKRRSQYVVPNSEDDSHPEEWVPFAEPLNK